MLALRGQVQPILSRLPAHISRRFLADRCLAAIRQRLEICLFDTFDVVIDDHDVHVAVTLDVRNRATGRGR